ncbi:DUF6489 family protein [Hyphobacterium indicum]|jgi:hypothetical protein|uniref:DUF6489 family protein n=1 Tax=Hyphobacterium indicum TaxID=2162714 RepID=UPI000D653540|nr:DUF6489 family protein [Hyphobacterium indicum]MBI1236514.1 hypothetical protein [Alphaproteobacteria bacterium]|tara:strand:+ start:415 stop:651 length:237 start_codon:yes stop_codon:yes gene_type:complete
MKVKIDIDCTPAEARAFFGLPDVTPLNEAMVKEMSRRMKDNMSSLEPDVLMKNWMSFGGQMQDQFMTLMRQAGQTPKE